MPDWRSKTKRTRDEAISIRPSVSLALSAGPLREKAFSAGAPPRGSCPAAISKPAGRQPSACTSVTERSARYSPGAAMSAGEKVS